MKKLYLIEKAHGTIIFFKRTIYLILRQPFSVYSGKRFEKYQKDYLKLTDLCTNKNEIEMNVQMSMFYDWKRSSLGSYGKW